MSSSRSRLHSYANHLPQDFPAREQFRTTFTHLGNLEDSLTALLPQLAQGHVDNPQQQGNSAVIKPQAVQFTVATHAPFMVITVTLPQNFKPPTQKLAQLQIVSNPNVLLASIVHSLESSTDASFAKNLKSYGPSSQTIWTLPDSNTFWRIQSSFDGKNFNNWSAPKQAS